MAGDIGHGTTIAWGTSSVTATLLDVSNLGEARAVIDVTSMSSPTEAAVSGHVQAVDEKIMGIKTHGPIEVDILYDPGVELPINAPSETITVTFPIRAGETTGTTWAGTGWLSEVTRTITVADKMMSTATIQRTGLWPIVNGS